LLGSKKLPRGAAACTSGRGSQRQLAPGAKQASAQLRNATAYSFRASICTPLHSIENLGSVVYQAYRVEIKPTATPALAKPAL
jgi:hypothetical protein